MPTLHNPLGWVMSATRRRELVAIARRHGLLLIEDAAYAFLAEDAPPPLASLAPETTVYVSSLSKSVATGLRVGFVSAPRRLVPKLERDDPGHDLEHPGDHDGDRLRLARGRHASAGSKPTSGATPRAPERSPADVARRACRVIGHPASYFVWLPLPEVRADAIAMALMRERISVSTADPFATSRMCLMLFGWRSAPSACRRSRGPCK